MSRFAILLAVAGGLLLASPAAAQRKIDRPIGFDGSAVGSYQVSVGAAWTDIDGSDFSSLTSSAIGATDLIVDIIVNNTHATQSLFLRLGPGGATATASTVEIPAGAELSLLGLLGADAGTAVTSLSLQGDGAATTGQVIAFFR